MIRYSIVIPAYNVRDYLGECLDSIVMACAAAEPRMRNAEVEIIAVDDGSTDGSGAFLDDYAAKAKVPANCRLNVVHKPNGGEGSARNAGLDAATGEWLLFVDADDVVRDTWLLTVETVRAAHSDADLIGFGKVAFETDVPWGEPGRAAGDQGIAHAITGALAWKTVYEFAYRRSVFGDLRFTEHVVGADQVYVCRAFSRSRRCLIADGAEYGYRQRSGSVMHTAMTVRKLGDIIGYHVDMAQALEASRKIVELRFWELRGSGWFWLVPRMILARGRGPDEDVLWERWTASMGVARCLSFVSGPQRLMARIAFGTRSRALVRLLRCVLRRFDG